MNRAGDTLELLQGKRKVFAKNYTNSPNIQEVIRKRAKFARKRVGPADDAALSAYRPRALQHSEKAELLGLVMVYNFVTRKIFLEGDETK